MRIAPFILMPLLACSPAAERSPEQAVAADRQTVERLLEAVRAGDDRAVREIVTSRTRIRHNRREAGSDAGLFVAALHGCRLLNTYVFGGNSLNPSQWRGNTYVVTDWACPVPSEPDGDTSWTFEFEKGALLRIHNDPVMF